MSKLLKSQKRPPPLNFLCGNNTLKISLESYFMFKFSNEANFFFFQKEAFNPNLRKFFSLKLRQKDIDYDVKFH